MVEKILVAKSINEKFINQIENSFIKRKKLIRDAQWIKLTPSLCLSSNKICILIWYETFIHLLTIILFYVEHIFIKPA